MTELKKITIKGFKSIKELVDFELRNLNIFIGANGSGKSNLIEFFKFAIEVIDQNLPEYVIRNGGIDQFFHNGRKFTEVIEGRIGFENHSYGFEVTEVTSPLGSCYVKGEIGFNKEKPFWGEQLTPDERSKLDFDDANVQERIFFGIQNFIGSWQIYHFNDTTKTAGLRNLEIIQDDRKLRSDAANLAAFLLKTKIKNPETFCEISNAVRLVMPYFDKFNLEIRQLGEAEKVNLSWFQKGSDYPFQPYHLSDGSIRFIALATALLQPEPPSLIIIDEPELGLHPEAIHILSELIKDASTRTQVIVSTQSPTLLDCFAVEDIVVVNRENGASTFKRLEEKDFSVWLEDYTVGQLWTKNVIAGGTASE